MSPRAIAIGGMMLVLPVAVPRIRSLSSSAVVAADDEADVEGEVGLGKLGAEGGEDPGQLVDRAVARSRR